MILPSSKARPVTVPRSGSTGTVLDVFDELRREAVSLGAIETLRPSVG